MKYYLNIFLIYGIIGFIFETILKLFNPSMNNGSMYGPWIPIYGLGACIIIAIMRLVFNRFKLKRIEKNHLYIIIATLIIILIFLIESSKTCQMRI